MGNIEKVEDLKFIVENKVQHILDDIETHILYGREFNYDKDMKQIQNLVLELKDMVNKFK